MLTGSVIVLASFVYVGLLFAIAYYGDKRADAGRSIIANPYIYALSLAVYCTSWTFYGSVGRAATSGIGFLPIFIGPTLMAMLWWYVMLKMIRISKANRITSIADFIASRYGKSQLLGGLVTDHRGNRHRALYLAAVESGIQQLLDHPEISGRRDGRKPGRRSRCSPTILSTLRFCSRFSPSCSARATSTLPSGTRAWWPR